MQKNFTLERQVHSSSIGKELHLCDIDVMFWKETNTCVLYNYPAPKQQQHLPPYFPTQFNGKTLRSSQSEKRVKLIFQWSLTSNKNTIACKYYEPILFWWKVLSFLLLYT